MDTITLELNLAGVEQAALAQLALGIPGCPHSGDMEARAAWYLGRLMRQHLADEARKWDEPDRAALKVAGEMMAMRERRSA